MNRITPGKILSAAVVLALLAGIGIIGNRLFTEEKRGPAGTEVTGDEPLGIELRTVTLYFGAPDSISLTPERRDVPARSDMAGNLTGALEDLAAGPLGPLVPTLPQGTRVMHVFLDGEGTAYVDFSPDFLVGMDGSLSREVMAIRSIARTLAANFTGLTRLQILVEGRIVPTLGGQLDLTRPLELSEWN